MQKRNRVTARPLRIVIAEDHHIVRDALRSRLEEAGLKVVGEAGDGRELSKIIARRQPDLLLMDTIMPYHDPAAAIAHFHHQDAKLKVVVLSEHKSPQCVVELFAAGVDAYVLKNDSPEALFQAIEHVIAGKRWVSPQLALVLAYFGPQGEPRAPGTFTRQELELLVAMSEGHTNRQIAERVLISESEVRGHIADIFRKLEKRYHLSSFAV